MNVALLSAMVAMAIDMLLPAFEQMRTAFGLPEDSASLALWARSGASS